MCWDPRDVNAVEKGKLWLLCEKGLEFPGALSSAQDLDVDIAISNDFQKLLTILTTQMKYNKLV